MENDLDSLTIDDIDSLVSAINKWKTKTGKPVTATRKRCIMSDQTFSFLVCKTL